jgi:hypothetical protein
MSSKAADVYLSTFAVNKERDAINLTQNFLGLEVLHQTDRIEMWLLGTHLDGTIKACTVAKLDPTSLINNVVSKQQISKFLVQFNERIPNKNSVIFRALRPNFLYR